MTTCGPYSPTCGRSSRCRTRCRPRFPLEAEEDSPALMDRRTALRTLGWGGAGFVLGGLGDVPPALAQALRPAGQAADDLAWNSGGPLVAYPEKLPLIVLTDRPVQLETPRQFFRHGFTDNAAFFVRWHLDLHPNAIDLSAWRPNVEGNVGRALSPSRGDLVNQFTPVSVAAVNQCSGNSRSRFEPRVPGGQWGNGAMGCATWTGVRLRELLERAGGGRGGGAGRAGGRGPGRGARRPRLASLPQVAPAGRSGPRRLSGSLRHERPAAPHAERFSGAARGSRVLRDLLDEVADLDPGADPAGRELLDEDRVPGAGGPAGGPGRDRAAHPAAGPVVYRGGGG